MSDISLDQTAVISKFVEGPAYGKHLHLHTHKDMAAENIRVFASHVRVDSLRPRGIIAITSLTAHSDGFFFKPTKAWIALFYSTSLAANLVGTCLLAYLLWSSREVETFNAQFRNTPIVVRVMMESGMLYSVVLAATLVLFACNLNAQYIIADALPSVIAISFYLIIIRLAIHRRRMAVISPGGHLSQATRPVPRGRPLDIVLTKSTEAIDRAGRRDQSDEDGPEGRAERAGSSE
ncbi:hypothetical protein PUNSTDRAFT_143182 [Punctularia strigosozonata HHB-11173 SS5]|uniref:uncharacterized protein n=1 Tax=Punctularia strigosozonata (strain HHB-11173) TaxID=741275 RepID=UPI0004416BE4|nr:uncharacterized protein PUNSTDRAFT_143182 [Punctularia strigosozonata HHB-11173 SS5]EIN09723.1 hypothetical protein PUNSTDRAFT_143182 [Punctularia strigosozonata HHB-11173 SS5]